MFTKKYEDLGPEEFKEMSEKADDAVIIDCRTMPEIRQASLEYDKHIDLMNPDFFNITNDLDKNKSYFIYCRSGNRSAQFCNFLAGKGFTKLYNLRGGIISWANRYGVPPGRN